MKEFYSNAKFILGALLLLMGTLFPSRTSAQNSPNAIPDQSKYYILIGEVTSSGTSGRTDVYQWNSSSAPNTCSIGGGGGEGFAFNPLTNRAYMATCCNEGKVRVYDVVAGSFLADIQLPSGEDILDIDLSNNGQYLFITTYKRVYRYSTAGNPATQVGFVEEATIGTGTNNFWGIDANGNDSRVFFSTNWRNASDEGASAIYSLPSDLSGNETKLADAPANFQFRGVVFDKDGNLWAIASPKTASNVKDRLYKFTMSGNSGNSSSSTYWEIPRNGNGASASNANVNAFDLAFGPDDRLYITTYLGDCVVRFNTTNNTFSSYLPYVAGRQAKTIAFVGGDFKCNSCDLPNLTAANVVSNIGTCNGATANNNSQATINGLTWVNNTTSRIEGAISEGGTFDNSIIFGRASNDTLKQNQTSFTFFGLKPNTQYTIRVWKGSDVCFDDVTFTTQPQQCFSCACNSNNLIDNSDMESGNPPSSFTAPQSTWTRGTGANSGNYGILNSGNTVSNNFIYQEENIGAGLKVTLNALAAINSSSSSTSITQVYMEFYNGTSLLATSAKYNVSNVYSSNTLTAITPILYTTPTNTTKVRVVGLANGRALYLDNIRLTRCYDTPVSGTLANTSVRPSCGGLSNGTLVINASGGSGSYQYKLNSGSFQNSNTFSTVGAGAYTITVRDVNAVGCDFTLNGTFECQNNCPNTLTNANPNNAEVRPGQTFLLSVNTTAANNSVVEWYRSTQNVTNYADLTTKTLLGEATVSAGIASLSTTAPTTVGNYYYYVVFKPSDPCNTFAKHTIEVKNIGSNNPICLSGRRAISNATLDGACNSSSTTTYSMFLDMTSGTGRTNYRYFRTSDLVLEEYCDGTAKILGKACAAGGSTNDCINISYTLSGRTATTPAISPAPFGCSNYANDLYYYPTGAGSITGVSGGIYAGLDISISENTTNSLPAFQIGTGGNTNTNTFGGSSGFEVTILNAGTNTWGVNKNGEFSFDLGSITTFPLIASASTTSGCSGYSTTLSSRFDAPNLPTCSSITYSWKNPSGTEIGNTANVTFNPIVSGNYSLTVTITRDGNTCTATDEIALEVKSTPTLSGTAPSIPAICAGQTLQLNSGTWTNASSYTWAGPNSFTSTSQNPTITNAQVNRSGTYTLTVRSADNCTASVTNLSAVVNPLPVGSITASIDSVVCSGETINLTSTEWTNAGTAADSYKWTKANSTFSQN
ncbi:MAG: hypothetical protein ACRCVT_06410, partial [Leadbetterella sp.]